ncbi:hypothetical protein ACQJBY_033920 [Aegilops geniculata]
MTPCSNPGAGAPTPRPPAATPRVQGAGVPRPVMSTYVNLGTAVRAAPTPQMKMQAAAAAGAPGIQARPRAVGAAVPTAGSPMPLPHTQGAPGAAVLPRPTSRGNLGGAPMPAAPSPMPRMRGARPGVPANTCPVGAAVPSAKSRMPVPMSMPPTQPALAVANPAAPSPRKRPPTTTGTAIPPAKRHAPTQGAPTGGTPLPTNPAAVAVVAPAPTPPRHAQGAPGNATPQPAPAPAPRFRYLGVYHDPGKGWMARVMDPKRGGRDIGPFDDEHQAALAHDRVAIACAGRGGGQARLNFMPAFYRVEAAFLHRWEGDVCEAVEKGGYEEPYAKYLKAGYKVALSIEAGDEGDEPQIANCVDAELFWEVVLEFFIDRANEIGQKALREGGDVLMDRFVEMYRNMALCPSWRGRYQEQLRLRHAMMIQQQQQQIQMQQQQEEQQIQMQQQQQLHIQKQQQIPMQQQQMMMMIQKQQQQQQYIQMQQQQMMIPKQEQMMKIQHQRQHQQQQHFDGDAILQVKNELI